MGNPYFLRGSKFLTEAINSNGISPTYGILGRRVRFSVSLVRYFFFFSKSAMHYNRLMMMISLLAINFYRDDLF